MEAKVELQAMGLERMPVLKRSRRSVWTVPAAGMLRSRLAARRG